MVDAQQKPKPEAPRPEGPTEPIRKYRRRQRWLLLLKLVILLLVILLGGLIYLQSGHALRHIYLPMAAKSLGTQITADSGSLNLTKGRLTLGNLTINGTDEQPAIQVSQIVMQVSLLSLISGDIPTVDEVRLIDPRVTVSVDEKGHSNLEFESMATDSTKASSHGEEPSQPQARKPSRPQLLPELRIGIIEIQNLVFNYEDAEGMSLNVDPLNLTAENIAPGETGMIDLNVTADVTRPAENLEEKANLLLKGSLIQAETRESLEWNVTINSAINGTVPGLDAPQSLDIKIDGKGTYQVTGRIEQQLTINATNPTGQAGLIEAAMTWDKEANQREATLNISDVGRDFLNPLISTFAPVQIVQSALNGQVKVKGIGESVVFETALSGRNLSFRTADSPEPTPPLNLSIANRGSYQSTSGMTTLEMVNMALDEKGRNLLEINLDQPVTLALGATGAIPAGTQSPSAHINLKIQTLTLDKLRPWLAIAGVTDTGDVQDATLNGNFKLAIEQMGKQLELGGHADVVNLRLASTPARNLAIRHDLSVNVVPGSAVNIGKATVNIEQGGNSLAEATASGQMKWPKGDADLNLELTVPKVLALAETFQPGTKVENIRDGRLTATQKIMMNPETQLVSVNGKAGLEGLALTLPQREPLPLKANLNYDVELDNAANRLRINPMRIEMAQASAGQPGVIEVKGDWPTGLAGPSGLPDADGSLVLTVRDLDAAPWLRLTSALREDALPKSLPITADNTLALQKGGTLKSSGELRVGPVDIKDENGLPSELSFKVNHEIEKIGQQLRTMVVDLTSQGASDSADKVHIEGSGQVGATTDMKLTSRIDRLDLTPYVALAEILTPEKSEDKSVAASSAPKADAALATKKTSTSATDSADDVGPATVVAMNLDVRKLLFKAIDVENVKGNLNMEDQLVSIKVDEGTINGGTLKLDAMNDSGRIEPRFSWDVSLDKVPVTPLLKTFSPENSDKLTGDLTLTSRGAGEGQGEALMRHLQSQTSFTIADGKMENYFILDVLAEQTKVESFKKLAFFKFAGDLDVADGKAQLNEWRVNGNVHQIAMNGSFKLNDGAYDLNLQAGVGSEAAEKITNNPYTGKLMMTDEGYLRFPLIISVKGVGDKYRVIPKLDVKGVIEGAVGQVGEVVKGIGGTAEDVGGAVGGLIEGLIDRKK